MVEINNQRKDVLDMLAWSEDDNGRQKTRNHGYDINSCRRRAVADCSITLANLSLSYKTQSTGAERYQLLSVVGMPTASSLAWKTSLEKVRTLWHCSRLRAWLPMIDRGDIRQAIDRCSNIWASLPGAGYGQFDLRLTAWLQNSKKRAERWREIDVWAESPRLSPLWLSASSSACHGLLIITVITPLPTKPSATKMPEGEAGERGNYWHADASAWCCCARCKIHEEFSWC